jgi:peptide-N4-(N-acetyl-beta-glucosaminyl)asparagine amidase
LNTRKGRCGEWANCFCLCLRAMNFDARYVLDWTDHVWCEVYSKSQKRWLHADPCENALDKPLIYEHGWNKKLSYVIAFSRHECVDVTWRYSTKHKEILTRRNECYENWLAMHTSEISKKRQVYMRKEERDALQLRLLGEIVEFMSPKQIKEGEDIGRQSGSLQWRLSRGEIQTPAVNSFFFLLTLISNF